MIETSEPVEYFSFHLGVRKSALFVTSWTTKNVASLSMRTLVVFVMLSLLVACDQPVAYDQVEFRVPVTTDEVGVATFESRIVATGTIRAREVARLTVLTGGILEFLHSDGKRIAEGDKVKRGQQIAAITGEDARLAARYTAASQRRDTARKNLDASLALFDTGALSETQLGQLRVTFEDAQLEFERALNTREQAKIVSPISGVILRVARDEAGQLLANGQRVEPGLVVAEVAPLRNVVVDVDVLGKDIADIKVGMPARARHYAWADHRFTGKVIRIAPTIDEKTRTLSAEVEIDNADGLLRPGMFIEVELIKEVRIDVPRVPRRAVVERGGKRVIFIVDRQRARQQPVTLGLRDDEWVEIVEGVAAGESIVVLGLETLVDQTPIRLTGDR